MVPSVAATLANATNITIFAPSNAALQPLSSNANFATLLNDTGFVQDFLKYHVLNQTVRAANVTTTPVFLHSLLTNSTLTNVTGGQVVEARLVGSNVTLSSGLGYTANVTRANVNITNGVVHIIDNILFPPANVSVTGSRGNLTALLGAVNATNLTNFVNHQKDLTIFAPSNAAFEAIGSILPSLSVADAANILGYHVINGTVAYSSLLANGTSVRSYAGGALNITVQDGQVFVNAARVIAADVLVANGVVHVIDAVLNPNSTARPDLSASSGIVQFPGASSGPVPYTSGVPTPTGSQIIRTTSAVASGFTPASTGALASASSSLRTSTGAAARATGAIGAAALFGGAAFMAQL